MRYQFTEFVDTVLVAPGVVETYDKEVSAFLVFIFPLVSMKNSLSDADSNETEYVECDNVLNVSEVREVLNPAVPPLNEYTEGAVEVRLAVRFTGAEI
jgi:hypothetical protein